MRTFFSIRPNALISHNILNFIKSLNYIDTTATIRILSRFHNPQPLLLVTFQEVVPLVVAFFLHMISLWNVLKWIFSHCKIVRFKVVIQCLFVA